MNRIVLVLYSIIFYQILDCVSCNGKYEAILENATECSKPQPPYATKRTWFCTFSMRRQRNVTYLSGRSKVLAEVPFTDFRADTFKVESGQERRLLHVDKQNCRSWLGKVFLVMGNFRYIKINCRVLKGTMGFSNVDMNSVFHNYPTWYSTGRFIHRPQLVHNGTTIFCMEISVWIRNLNK